MSYKFLQFPTHASTRENSMRIAIRGPWSTPSGSRDVEFLQSWLEYDSHLDDHVGRGRVNWGLVLGLAVAIGVSASFWTGVGIIAAHIWK